MPPDYSFFSFYLVATVIWRATQRAHTSATRVARYMLIKTLVAILRLAGEYTEEFNSEYLYQQTRTQARADMHTRSRGGCSAPCRDLTSMHVLRTLGAYTSCAVWQHKSNILTGGTVTILSYDVRRDTCNHLITFHLRRLYDTHEMMILLAAFTTLAEHCGSRNTWRSPTGACTACTPSIRAFARE